MTLWLILIGLIIMIGLILYWQFIIAEGAYLGAPLVALLYDWTAERYNAIKEFDQAAEDFTLGEPLANRLSRQPAAMMLDVATGTGRIPLVLARQPAYRGHMIGLDRAARMLKVAQRETATLKARLTLVQADAMALPFADESLPLVTCLEALEFLPDPEAGLAELIRVLRPPSPRCPPCGWLLTTSRIGWEARLMPGKTWSRARLHQILDQYLLDYINIQAWQEIYDLVWAQKMEPPFDEAQERP